MAAGDEYGGPKETVPERDAFADASRTGPGPSRESAMMDIPDYLLHAEAVPTGWAGGLKKDRPAG
jgi:hypothetical protein